MSPVHLVLEDLHSPMKRRLPPILLMARLNDPAVPIWDPLSYFCAVRKHVGASSADRLFLHVTTSDKGMNGFSSSPCMVTNAILRKYGGGGATHSSDAHFQVHRIGFECLAESAPERQM
jgi:hypothetical protein